MAFLGLDLSTLGNLGRAASKGIEDNALANERKRLIGNEDADRQAGSLLIKAVMNPSEDRVAAAMAALEKASPAMQSRSTPYLQQIAQLPAKMEAERVAKEQETQIAPFNQAEASADASLKVAPTVQASNQKKFAQRAQANITSGGATPAGLPELMQDRAQTEAEFSAPKTFRAQKNAAGGTDTIGIDALGRKASTIVGDAPAEEPSPLTRTFELNGQSFELDEAQVASIQEQGAKLQQRIQRLPAFLQSNQIERSFAQNQALLEDILNRDGVIGASDISIINTFQRMIDPATVRDGDVVLIQSAESLLSRVAVKLSNLKTGQKLSAELRADMRRAGKVLINAYRADARKKANALIESNKVGEQGLLHPLALEMGRRSVDSLVGEELPNAPSPQDFSGDDQALMTADPNTLNLEQVKRQNALLLAAQGKK